MKIWIKHFFMTLFIGLQACTGKHIANKLTIEQPVNQNKYFALLNHFEQQKASFETDTFNFYNQSTEGGVLIMYNNKQVDYEIYNFWVYGETGKLNYIYWTTKNNRMNFKFIKQMKYDYDRPMYVEGYQIDSNIYYLAYTDSTTILFNADKTEITDSNMIANKNTELTAFFEGVRSELGF